VIFVFVSAGRPDPGGTTGLWLSGTMKKRAKKKAGKKTIVVRVIPLSKIPVLKTKDASPGLRKDS
jgi:hypothetical protein